MGAAAGEAKTTEDEADALADNATDHIESTAGNGKESALEEDKHASAETKEEAGDEDVDEKESDPDSAAEKEAKASAEIVGEDAGGECAATSEDCRQSRCCKDKKMVCFEKDSDWASCQAECVPGKHASDPAEFRSPWTCKKLSDDK